MNSTKKYSGPINSIKKSLTIPCDPPFFQQSAKFFHPQHNPNVWDLQNEGHVCG